MTGSSSPPPQDALYLVSATRVADSRCTGPGPPAYCPALPKANASLGPLAPGSTETVLVAGVGGVPSQGVDAVLVTVTAEDPGAWGWLAAFPAGGPVPTVSTVNWVAGELARANEAVVPVGQGGSIALYSGATSGATNFQVDVVGYFGPQTSEGGLLYPLGPTRIADTRCTGPSPSSLCSSLPPQNAGLQVIPPGATEAISVAGVGGVPASGASGVVMNVTVPGATSGGFLSILPASSTQPSVSSLNWVAGETTSARVVAALPASGQLYLYNGSGSPVNVAVDLDGWISGPSAPFDGGLAYQPVQPFRLFDTRCSGTSRPPICSQLPPANQSLTTFGPGAVQSIQGTGSPLVAPSTKALALNLTATDSTAWSYFSSFAGQSVPWASDLNWSGGQTVANLSFVGLSSSGSFQLYNAVGTVDGVGDVFGYFFAPVPVLYSLSPAVGGSQGGAQVSISGLNLAPGGQAPQVLFGSTKASSVACSSSTSCVATAPPGTGSVQVTVVTAFGTSNGLVFQYVSSPTVSAISPSSGLVSGGITVTITGSNFVAVSQVSFGSQPAASFTVDSSTQITAVAPASQSPGPVDVTVTNPAGTSSTSSADVFTYVLPPPQLSSISPNQGPTSGGITVTLSGSNFYTSPGATQVYFGSVRASGVSCGSSSQCTATAPPGTGVVQVTVVTPGGTSNGQPFTYYGTFISALSPTSPGVMGVLTISGSGFGTSQGAGYVRLYDANTKVSWGAPGNEAYFEVLSWSDTQIKVQVPSDSGWWAGAHWEPNAGDSVQVTVTTDAGNSSNTVTFTVGQPTTYSYTVTNSAGANVRSGPATFYSIVKTLASGATVRIVCQGTGEAVADSGSPSGTSDIWDLLDDGNWVSDTLVSTPSVNEFSPGIPQCTGYVKNPYADNSAGFDINQYSTTPASGCSTSTLPIRPYAPNIVQADGGPDSYYNGCMGVEANWDTGYQGNGYPPLEVVFFPGAGHDSTGPPQCGGNQECNHGYNVAQATYNHVKSVLGGLTPKIWLLDVECGGGSGWYPCESTGASSYTDNIQAITGTLYFFMYHSLYVGIYSSPYEWSTITNGWSTVTANSPFFVVGDWLAAYGPNAAPFPTACNGPSANSYLGNSSGAQPFSGGPLWMWQYSSNVPSGSSTFDGDLSCYQG
jgi:uncharacterized protein YraI